MQERRAPTTTDQCDSLQTKPHEQLKALGYQASPEIVEITLFCGKTSLAHYWTSLQEVQTNVFETLCESAHWRYVFQPGQQLSSILCNNSASLNSEEGKEPAWAHRRLDSSSPILGEHRFRAGDVLITKTKELDGTDRVLFLPANQPLPADEDEHRAYEPIGVITDNDGATGRLIGWGSERTVHAWMKELYAAKLIVGKYLQELLHG